MSDSVIAQLKASTVRRGFALFVMMLLGFLLLYLTVTIDAGFVHKAVLGWRRGGCALDGPRHAKGHSGPH